MRIGVDTNVLVNAHVSSLEDHSVVRRHLLGRLAEPDTILVLSPLILHELVHVITDARRFDPPVDMIDALAIARLYLGRHNVECISVGEPAALRAIDLIERHRLGRRRVADALFAATLLEAGVDTLLTCNVSDFSVFEGLTLVDPRRA